MLLNDIVSIIENKFLLNAISALIAVLFLKEVLPFKGHHTFFQAITLFAAGNDIILG